LLQPSEYIRVKEIFQLFEKEKSTLKRDLILAINKLSLQTDQEKGHIRIWSSHNYDLSRDVNAIVSTKYVDSRDLEIYLPRPNQWLGSIEYVPSHIILKHKKVLQKGLKIDIDFLITLDKIRNGYPIALVSNKYEQQVKVFVQDIEDLGYAEIYDEHQIIIANKRKSYKKSFYIVNNKYKLDVK